MEVILARLLDLFCCEGGAAAGYMRAGFTEIVGVDSVQQRRYPYEFIQADVLELTPSFLASFDAIHASPPCQFGSELTPEDARSRHLNLIPATRALLRRSGRPYVIENVRNVREHLINPVSLFGTMFGNHLVTSTGQRFDLSRERLFETNWFLAAPPDPGPGQYPIANVFGGHLRARSGEYRTGGGTGRTVDFPGEDRPALARQLMEMPWATMRGMSEAVPPSFTAYIGRKLLPFTDRETWDLLA